MSTQKRTVNQSLGESPGIAFVPGNQFLYWVLFCAIGWYVGEVLRVAIKGGILVNLFTVFWLILSWTLLTGKRPWIFASSWIKPPNWCCGFYTYKSLLSRRYRS